MQTIIDLLILFGTGLVALVAIGAILVIVTAIIQGLRV